MASHAGLSGGLFGYQVGLSGVQKLSSAAPNHLETLAIRPTVLERYTTWEQVGGYFDGDGNVGLEVVRYVLRFRLRFSDTWEPQVTTIRSFMSERNIKTTGIQHETKPGRLDAFRIDINAIDGVPRASKAMLPFCLKKAEDLKILVDYLEGRITGNQAIERYNEEVRIGRRSGYVRDSVLPYTRAEGLPYGTA